MDQAIADARLRTGEPRGVLVVDLDELRQVNETLGRDHGDDLLKTVAERLVGCLRDSATPWRASAATSSASCRRDETDVETAAATVAWKVRRRSSSRS